MKLKSSYSAREVAALTGLTGKQLQWWASAGLFHPAIEARKTTQGGFTERRYSPVDLLELLALADLRRQGFDNGTLKQMMDALRDYFRRRLAETLDEAGELRLLTNGDGLFLSTRQGHVFDLLVDPMQALLGSDVLKLKPVKGKAARKKTPTKTGKKAKS
ncbi:MAG: MerR family transcriptional regulator [Acidobacteria bacterium]|jgi:DNA-binding transcriptional MerR regulator|nr:MerR family transcriptional regulator [Acidobacteriota bacterium]